MVVGVHFMSLELGGRTMGLCRPMMATYRPHNSPLMEWVQTRGRLRSNKAMIDRRNLSGLVHALKAGEAVWFAPDQDYGPKGSVFAPFFSVPQAATTNGTYVLSRLSGAKMLSISMVRKMDRKGYTLYISDVLNDYPGEDKQDAASYINRVIEKRFCARRSNICGYIGVSKPARWARAHSTKPTSTVSAFKIAAVALT